MRYAQKNFFAAKDKIEKQSWLRASRAYEKAMDDEIDRVNGILNEKRGRATEAPKS